MNHSKKVKSIKKTPWPTKEAMAQIYNLNLWGGKKGTYYSGEGSHKSELVAPYIEELTKFLKSFKKQLIVCDLGCGDFNIGNQIYNYTQKYIGVDIVPELVAFLRESYSNEKLEFLCLDIAKDALPKADCIILRQVLQHLSNEEVGELLFKLVDYKYVIFTDHIPLGDFEPNKDIVSGQSIRIKKRSGLDLLSPPFNMKIKSSKTLLEIKLENYKGIIKTTLFQMP